MIQKNSRYAWFIWVLGASFFFFEYIVRVSPGVLVHDLIQAFNINAYQIGLLSSAFSLSYISMQIPVGTLVDKYSVRLLVGFMALLCAACTVLFATTTTFHLAVFARFLIGITGAFAFVGALKIATLFFSPKHFGLLAGMTQALGMLGASAGIGPLSAVVQAMGWRSTLLSLGGLIGLLSVLIFLLVKDKPMTSGVSSPRHSILDGLVIVFKNPHTWVNVLIIGLLYAPTMVFGELWGPLYINRVYHLTSIEAASVVSVIFIGWAIGSPLFGWISDRIQRRKPIIIASVGFSLLFISILLYCPNLPLSWLFVMAFLYGFSNVGVSTCYAVACELTPNQYAGTALGFTNMASILLGALFQPLVGWLLDKHWSGQWVDGVRYYSAGDLQSAMVALPICLVFCLILCLFLKESYGGNQHSRSAS
jgi:sugar phosphate permease